MSQAKSGQGQGTLRIISWNVNGFRAVWGRGFERFVEGEKPDILCIQETKAWEEQLTPEQRRPAGYYGRFTRPERKGYSGVATFSRWPLDVAAEGYGIPEFDREGRVLITRHQGLLVANIYFPNGKQSPERLDYKMRFYDATLDYFRRMLDEGRQVVVVGDYNTAHRPIDLARPKENEHISGFLPEEREWIDRWIAAGFVDIFRRFNEQPGQYTWWDMRTGARERNIGWRIDYFFVGENLADRVRKAWISPEVMGSDHCPLGIEIA